MACGIGVCMTCVLPVVGDDGVTRMVRSCVEGPVFRGDRVRWADVGTVPPDTLGRTGGGGSLMTRCTDHPTARSQATSRRGPTSTWAPSLGGVELPNPVMTASGCAAAGRELDQFFDITELGAVVTKSSCCSRAPGGPRRGWPRRPSGMLNSIGLQGRASTRSSSTTWPGWRERGARASSRSPAARSTSTRSSPQRLRHRARRVTAIEVNISCPNVENRGLVFACDPGRRPTSSQAVRAPQRPADADLRQAVARRHRHRGHRRAPCVGAGADGLSDDQHPARHGHRHRHDAAPPRRASPAGCPARRSGRSPCAASGRSARRCPSCRSSAWAASAPASTP